MKRPYQTKQIAGFALMARYEDIQADTINQWKRHRLDALGSFIHATKKFKRLAVAVLNEDQMENIIAVIGRLDDMPSLQFLIDQISITNSTTNTNIPGL